MTQNKKYLTASILVLVIISIALIGFFISEKKSWKGTSEKNPAMNVAFSGTFEPKNVAEYFDGIDIARGTDNHADILGKEIAPVLTDYRQENYDGAITKQEALIQEQKSPSYVFTGSEEARKIKTIGNSLFLANLYLEKANNEQKEKEFAPKAIAIVSGLSEDDYGAYGMYFVGYAYEISKEYDKALLWYEKWLKVSSNTDKLKAVFKNQIGHVYDVRGDMAKAYTYYMEAYALDKTNYAVATNIGRYLARTDKFEEAMKFFEYALGTPSLRLRAELYFSMSSIVLAMNGFKPDIDLSIEYAQKWIELAPKYAMGYVALARGLYMKNNPVNYDEINKNLDKALKLYPNSYYAYELLALNTYDQGKLKESIDFLDKSLYAIKNDGNLMESEKASRNKRINLEKYLLMIAKGKFTKSLYNYILLPDGKDLIRFQLKRIDYGYLGKFKKEDWFAVLLKMFK